MHGEECVEQNNDARSGREDNKNPVLSSPWRYCVPPSEELETKMGEGVVIYSETPVRLDALRAKFLMAQPGCRRCDCFFRNPWPNEATYRVAEINAGYDGAVLLTDVEKLNFTDVSADDLTVAHPLPVADAVAIAQGQGSHAIRVGDLIANDRNWRKAAISVRAVAQAQGGSITGAVMASGQTLRTRAMDDGSQTLWEYDQAGYDAKKAVINTDWNNAVAAYNAVLAEQATAMSQIQSENTLKAVADTTYNAALGVWNSAHGTFSAAQTSQFEPISANHTEWRQMA